MSHQDVDLQIINGDGDGGVTYGRELMTFAQAIASRDASALRTSREQLQEVAGSEVLVDAAAVAANFQRMVRIADSTGIPVDGIMGALSDNIGEQLNLQRFASAENTPQRSTIAKLLGIPARLLARGVLRAGDRKSRSE